MQADLPPRDFCVLSRRITTFKKLPMMRPKTKKIIVRIEIIFIFYNYAQTVPAPIVAFSGFDFPVLSTHHILGDTTVLPLKGTSAAQALALSLHVAIAPVPVPFQV